MYVFIIALVLSISINGFLFMQNRVLSAQNQEMQTLLDVQNQAIQKQKLESEKYACSLESMNEYTKSKYESVTESAQSCEAKLEEFEKALGIFKFRE